MEQRLYRVLHVLRSLRSSWILVLCLVNVSFLSCAYFLFEVVVVFPVWVSQTQRSAHKSGCGCPIHAAVRP